MRRKGGNQSGRGSSEFQSFKGPRWHLGNVLTNLDFYGKDVPAFNIKGQNRVNTIFGGIMTSMVLLLTLVYTVIKLDELYSRQNPIISEWIIHDNIDPADVIDLNGIDFKFAFTIEGFYDKKRKDSHAYIKLLVNYMKTANG